MVDYSLINIFNDYKMLIKFNKNTNKKSLLILIQLWFQQVEEKKWIHLWINKFQYHFKVVYCRIILWTLFI